MEAKRARIQLPLSPSPYITKASEASKGILARKTKTGRWRFEVVERKKWEVQEASEDAPKIGVDVGLNVMAATSDGRLLGSDLKPKFNKLYERVRNLRANRQRQNLKDNSPRLDHLESKLSGLVKSAAGEAANKLVKAYPGYVFIVEDLDLSGCRGQKRFAYRALHHSLENKAPTRKVNPAYSSQTCPSCGHVSRRNRSGTKFHCQVCGREGHADGIGGIGLLRRSEDKQIGLEDHPSVVKPILEARHEDWKKFQTSLSVIGRSRKALSPASRELTTKVSKELGTASNYPQVV
jgi:putative transposase